jgi:AraC-like DNA-binding protein
MDSAIKKNVATGIYEEYPLEPDFHLLVFANEQAEKQHFKREVQTGFVQFHFVLKGQVTFGFNQQSYQIPLDEGRSLLLYNPQRELPVSVDMEPAARVISIVLSISRLHAMFSTEANYIPFLSSENRSKKYYMDGVISPSVMVVLNHMFTVNLHHSVKGLFYKAKALELLSLYFNRPTDLDTERCPFLADESNVARIRKAKEIVVNRVAEPPTLQELAEEVHLPVNRLKEGFKQVYGDTVFSFLFDYKMEMARQLLAAGDHNVNEVGHTVGYSTASHFIAAFKKKFGSTPKQYVKNLS